MTNELTRLRARVRELEEELAEWRRFGATDDDSVSVWRKKLGMAPQMIKALRLLMANPGKSVAREKILMAITTDAENLNLASVIICRVRQRLSSLGMKNAITSLWGHGYTITPEAAARVREIVG